MRASAAIAPSCVFSSSSKMRRNARIAFVDVGELRLVDLAEARVELDELERVGASP